MGRCVRLRAHRLLAASVCILSGCAQTRITIPILPPLPMDPASLHAAFWTEPFNGVDPERWKDVEVESRHSVYEPVLLDDRPCLRARSQGGASILLAEVRFDPEKYEWFSWDWRVDQLVAGEALERKDGSDAAARVYVYFDTGKLPWQKRNLDYVWSATLPAGTVLNSAFSPASKIIIVESGTGALGQWRHVERNLEEDYELAFGKQSLPDVVAIGVMSDSDNTGGESLAYFDDLRVSARPRSP
jgi:hypothetical protein